jgi:hypothetical protein
MQPGDPAVTRDSPPGLVQDQPWCEPPDGRPQPLVGGVRHLNQEREGLIRILVQPGVERVEVELADLRRDLGEPWVLGQLGAAGGPRRGFPLP